MYVYPTQSDHNRLQGAALHGDCITEDNTSTMQKSPKHMTYLTDVASQLSDFTNDSIEQSKANKPIGSEDRLDISTNDTLHDLDNANDFLSASEIETSCEHSNAHLVTVDNEDNEVAKIFKYEFISSNFTTKVGCIGCS